MPKQTINECYNSFTNNYPLNDDELKRLHRHMDETAKMLSSLGDTFHLAMIECLRVSIILKGYIDARNEKRGFFRKSIEGKNV